MSSQGGMESNVEQEREIPVFTVVKNNAILKNIFLINSGSSISEANREDSSKTFQDSEQTLLVGRHPDCDIRLEHPSISRFHLQILAKPSSKRLFVTDLSSVHGTWISGKRIEPNIRVDVNEGDALRIGGSSRVYRLHWIPFHKAYDSNNPFVPPLDVPPPDEENEDETEKNENALVLENGGQSVNLSSPEYMLSYQLKTSGQMEDVSTLLSQNEDGKSLELGCECSLDSALEAIKALVSKQFEASKELQDENAQIMNEKTVDTTSDDLGLNPNFKPTQEAEVLSVAPPLEAMKVFDMPLESSGMQFVNFAWEGSEILLHLEGPLLIALGENELSRAMQETVDHNMVEKYEGMPLVLNWEDNMSISQDTEEDGEKEGKISGSAGPLGKLAINSLKENECEEEKDNKNKQVEEETKSLGDLLFSQESSLTEIQWESSSGSSLTSNLMENLDVARSESIADETLVINKNLISSCDDEEMDDAWSFWSLSNQGLESENASQVRNSFEDTSSGEIQSSLWAFWSRISEAKSVHSSSLSDGGQSHVEIQSACGSLCCIHTMETLCSEPPEERSPDRAQSATNLKNQINRTLQERLDGIGINNEARMLNDGSSYDPLERALFTGTDMDFLDLEEEGYFTPEKENYTRGTQVVKGKSGTSNKHLPSLKKSQVLITTAKACTDSENGLSAYSNKENMTPKVIWEHNSGRYLSEEHTNSSILKKREMGRAPLQTLFADSSPKSVSEAHMSGDSLFAYSNMNKENETPKAHQEQKSARHSSTKCMKLSLPSKGEEQRMPLKTLFADSPQKSISNSLTSGDATLSACSNKENQTPKFLQEQKSARHPSAGHTKLFLLKKQEAESIPFQTLFLDSPQKNVSHTHISNVSARAGNPTTCEDSIDKSKHSKSRVKRWTMLVDIASLLDKNSRKALQLLEGIKGTQLIIPRAVVNELDAMKQKPSFFRKNTEAYLASQWIEECAVRTKWWIQIQSSMDDDDQISTALLPNSTSYRAYGTLPKKASKSIDDHVLDYALYFRKIQNDGQLVLLSDDSTMKIKAMAEGLICETAEDFQGSLVNPFSKRFMWADSLPRGRTWSYLEDVIAMQKLYPGAMKTTLKGVQNARGLKILLLHDSISIHQRFS